MENNLDGKTGFSTTSAVGCAIGFWGLCGLGFSMKDSFMGVMAGVTAIGATISACQISSFNKDHRKSLNKNLQP